jgi:hypothetical protein
MLWFGKSSDTLINIYIVFGSSFCDVIRLRREAITLLTFGWRWRVIHCHIIGYQHIQSCYRPPWSVNALLHSSTYVARFQWAQAPDNVAFLKPNKECDHPSHLRLRWELISFTSALPLLLPNTTLLECCGVTPFYFCPCNDLFLHLLFFDFYVHEKINSIM